MSRAIWKFPCLSTGPFCVDVQAPGHIRHVGRDPATGLIAFWAEVDPYAPKRQRKFQIFATGDEIPIDASPLGTVILDPLVWHLFELRA
jgi:hypothetical protein